MIVVLADSPSKSNFDPKKALVGTLSYKKFLEWLLGLS
jgi:hypothetical protein